MDGVCTEDNPTCAESGNTEGYSRCYSGVLGAKTADCCDPFVFPFDGTSAMCMDSEDTDDNGDRFCMKININAGDACGTTKAANYAGICWSSDGSLSCVNNACYNATDASTTSTVPTPTLAPCSAAGTVCWDAATNQPTANVTCCGTCAFGGFHPGQVDNQCY